jgi:hypothetical protein
VHFAADTAGQMRIFATIFYITQYRVTNRSHMHAQLMRAPG